jgi:hypothetical protein
MKLFATFAKLAGLITAIGGLIFLFDTMFSTSTTRLVWASLASVSICSVVCFANYAWQTWVMKSVLDERRKRGLLAVGGLCTLALLASSLFGARESVVASETARVQATNQMLLTTIRNLQDCTNQLSSELAHANTRFRSVDELEQNYDAATMIIIRFRAKFDAGSDATAPRDVKTAIKQFLDESRPQMQQLEADRLNRTKRNSLTSLHHRSP